MRYPPTQVYVPKVIETKYPDLTPQEVEEVRQHVVANAAFKASSNGGLPELNNNLIKMADKFINVKDLDIDLIDSINPFQLAYEIMSKSVDADVLKRIHGAITARRIQMTEEEAVALWPRIKSFRRDAWTRTEPRRAKPDGAPPSRGARMDQGQEARAYARPAIGVTPSCPSRRSMTF